jgi:CheY-like chemotaxis protein
VAAHEHAASGARRPRGAHHPPRRGRHRARAPAAPGALRARRAARGQRALPGDLRPGHLRRPARPRRRRRRREPLVAGAVRLHPRGGDRQALLGMRLVEPLARSAGVGARCGGAGARRRALPRRVALLPGRRRRARGGVRVHADQGRVRRGAVRRAHRHRRDRARARPPGPARRRDPREHHRAIPSRPARSHRHGPRHPRRGAVHRARVPRDARARAAQPARAAAQRAADLRHRARRRPPPPGDRHHGAAGRGTWCAWSTTCWSVGRITAASSSCAASAVELATVHRSLRSRNRAPAARGARGHELQYVDMPEEPLRVDADPVRLAQVPRQPARQRREVHAAGRRIGSRCVATGRRRWCRSRQRHRHPGGRAVPRVRPVLAGPTAVAGARGASASASHWCASSWRCTAAAGGPQRRPGRAAEFTVRCRCAMAASTTAPSCRSAPGRSAPARVLVVDDNIEAASTASRAARPVGPCRPRRERRTGGARRGRPADPALVLLDLGMPGMDGWRWRGGCGALPGGDDLRIALDRLGAGADRQRTREAGFDHHIVKPAELDALRSLLATLGPAPRAAERPAQGA